MNEIIEDLESCINDLNYCAKHDKELGSQFLAEYNALLIESSPIMNKKDILYYFNVNSFYNKVFKEQYDFEELN